MKANDSSFYTRSTGNRPINHCIITNCGWFM